MPSEYQDSIARGNITGLLNDPNVDPLDELKLDISIEQRNIAREADNCSMAEVRLFGLPIMKRQSQKGKNKHAVKSAGSKEEGDTLLGGLCFPFMASIKSSVFEDGEALMYRYGDDFWYVV